MSYRPPNTGDPELDKRLRDEDYDMLFPRLTEAIAQDIGDAKDDQRFNVWLDKLALIDQGRVAAWLREHWPELNRVRRVCARVRLSELQDLSLE